MAEGGRVWGGGGGGGGGGGSSHEQHSFQSLTIYIPWYPCSPDKCSGFHHSEVADHEKAQDAVVGSCPWTVWFITPSNCNAQEMMYRKEGY